MSDSHSFPYKQEPRLPGEHWALSAIPFDNYFFPLAIEPTAES